MMINLRPENFRTWAPSAIKKIERTIDSCESMLQLKVAKKMIDNFIVMSVMQEHSDDEDIQWISHQLWLRTKLKELQINGL